MKILLLVAAAASVTYAQNNDVLGQLIMGVSALGTGVGKQVVKTAGSGVVTGVTAVKETTGVATGVGKLAVAGAGAVVSDLLDNTGDVLNNAIGIVDVVGENLGNVGKPLEDIGQLGHDAVDLGVSVGNKGISDVEQVGIDTLTTVDNVVSKGSDAVISATKVGEVYLDNLLDNVNQGVDNLFG